jgi:hypothetical protein
MGKPTRQLSSRPARENKSIGSFSDVNSPATRGRPSSSRDNVKAWESGSGSDSSLTSKVSANTNTNNTNNTNNPNLGNLGDKRGSLEISIPEEASQHLVTDGNQRKPSGRKHRRMRASSAGSKLQPWEPSFEKPRDFVPKPVGTLSPITRTNKIRIDIPKSVCQYEFASRDLLRLISS